MDTLTPNRTPADAEVPFPSGRRPQRRRWLAAAIGALLVVLAISSVGGNSSHPMTSISTPLDPQVAGVYEFASGEQLTLYGRAERPSFELEGVTGGLTPTGPDQYVTTDDAAEGLALVRAPSGRVVELVHTAGDAPPRTATWIDAYTEEQVRIASGDVELAGTVLVPSAPGPHPGVVIVHGAERATRETYRLLATHYARRGVAALIYDKRGLGDSTGDVATATFDDLTADALAGIDLLRHHPRIDPDHVGIAGFSQGGWVAAMGANRAPEVAFVVAYSASGFSPADQNAWLHGNMLAVRGFAERPIASAERAVGMLYSTTGLVDAGLMPAIPHVPGFWFHALDLHLGTASLWQQVEQPTLGIWGADDCQVPAHDSARALDAALEAGPNTNRTLLIADGADHGLTLTGPCEHELGIHGHSRMRYAPEYLVAGAEWINGARLVTEEVELRLGSAGAAAPLAWHHGATSPAPWYGTFLPQLLAMLLIVVVPLVTMVRSAAALRRPTSGQDRATTRLSLATSATALAAGLSGIAAVAELAALGGLHAMLLVGSGPVNGVPPLFMLAGGLTLMTAGLALAPLAVSVARGRLRAATSPRMIATLAGAAGLALWASYWHLI
jgi:uncharacterized protein